MRITTNMLHASLRKTGLPIGNTSMLNYINRQSSTTGNSLLSALSKKSKADSTQKSYQSGYEQSADQESAMESKSEQYSATGQTLANYLSSKYNLWG